MPRRDWSAKLEREYGYLREQRARAVAVRFVRTHPVRAPSDVGRRRPRPSPGTRGVA
jgi:hypothetical protein